MSGLQSTAAPLALRDEIEATHAQIAVSGRRGIVIALAFEGDEGMSYGTLSQDLDAAQLLTAAEQVEAFAREIRTRARAARS